MGCIQGFGWDLPSGSDGKESACSTGGPGSVAGLGRFPGEGSGYPLQCSCLENFMDRGAWQATVHGVTKSRILLSKQHFHFHQHAEQARVGEGGRLMESTSVPGGKLLLSPWMRKEKRKSECAKEKVHSQDMTAAET